MTKIELCQAIARKIDGCTRADVQTVLEVYADTVKEVLSSGKEDVVVLPNLGKFSVKDVSERSGISSLDGKAWKKPAHKEIKFTVAKSIKEI